MSSNESASVSSASSSSLRSPIILYEISLAKDVSAKRLSSATVTTITSDSQSEDGNLEPKTATLADNSLPSIPAPLEHHRNRMDLVSEWIQNIQPEKYLVDHLLPQLTIAVVLLRELRRSFGLDPNKLLEESDTQRFWAAMKEDNVDTVSGVYIDEDMVLDPEILVDLTQVSEDCSIDNEIPHVVELLEIVKSLQMDCRDGRLVQLLPPRYRCTIAIVYLATIQTLNYPGFVKSEKLEVFRSLGLLLQRKPTGSIAI
ncbi:hypothetical protein FOQG_18743 [Fusarium oxysporum f. sp. raphani 54005]|uniref:Uncharacterized protein n=1 Tax=Fusarium oxysporum f. sp. raphani 54005 TaxID=1089458 RepID=X0BDE1_FUSOX|nr:hypothetical protein FOQG_18743 [Fusarium oxysporum f. sp. raphani 54005]